MDFESAVDLSRQIEQNFRPPLLVVGFRRQREEDPDSWAIDLLESSTRQLVTLDEKDDWHGRLTRDLTGASHG